ncbi:DNA-directed RNA polymerase subunit beta [Virgibacillus byunsanensis]|uniref:DNA-directed RNA polymerase subunit beta n=1 Tax=Virgibacillus byunsanensis TaxID=570945 RepID=A0ABW3LEQ6_9BACI
MPTKQSETPVTRKQSNKKQDQSKKRARQKSREQEQQTSDKLTRKQQKKKQKEEKRKNKKPRRRIFPIWLRVIFVLLLAAGALALGLMVGYGILGDGTPRDALEKDTWQHIIDIVTQE